MMRMMETLLLVSPRKPSTGNHVTVDRIERALSSFGFRIVRFDSEVKCGVEIDDVNEAVNVSQSLNGDVSAASSNLLCSQSQSSTIPTKTRLRSSGIAIGSSPSSELLQARKQLRETVIREKASAIIGIHAIHAGKLLLDDSNQRVDVGGIPFAIVFGGTDINEAVNHPLELDLMTTIVNQSTFLVAFHQGIVEKCISTWPETSKKIRCIPPSVQVHRLLPSTLPTSSSFTTFRERLGISNSHEEALLFVLPCGLRPVKDPLFLVDEFSAWHQRTRQENNKLKEEDEATRLPLPYLLIIGPILDREYSTVFFSRLQLSRGGEGDRKESPVLPGILYHEAVTQETLHFILSEEGDVLVNSSISEGLSNVILEAMFLELPVFARKNEGNASVIRHNVTGKLFQTPEEFVEGSIELMHNGRRRRRKNRQEGEGEEEVDRIVRNAREFVEKHHSIEMEARLYCDLVVDMIRKTP